MTASRMPALFIGHGSPMNALEDNANTRVWAALGGSLPRPRAILCLSAHFAGAESLVVTAQQPETIHDFYGFPKMLYDIRYPAPGSPALAERVSGLFPKARATGDWGIDHGAWSVLVHLYPKADIPVVQLSLDLSLKPEEQLAIGRALQPLRDEGVLILGSGNIAHNLRLMQPGMSAPFDWAKDFDTAVSGRLTSKDRRMDDYMSLPGAAMSVPTSEHFAPLLYVLGAGCPQEAVTLFNQAYVYGSLSMTGCVISSRERNFMP